MDFNVLTFGNRDESRPAPQPRTCSVFNLAQPDIQFNEASMRLATFLGGVNRMSDLLNYFCLKVTRRLDDTFGDVQNAGYW